MEAEGRTHICGETDIPWADQIHRECRGRLPEQNSNFEIRVKQISLGATSPSQPAFLRRRPHWRYHGSNHWKRSMSSQMTDAAQLTVQLDQWPASPKQHSVQDCRAPEGVRKQAAACQLMTSSSSLGRLFHEMIQMRSSEGLGRVEFGARDESWKAALLPWQTNLDALAATDRDFCDRGPHYPTQFDRCWVPIP
jgi:hypothetical protein